ncbi:TauD/TfdA family dioxygenase [Natronospirillum operosum]|uniref:TauD/TfdA family dioxygenase n=1 Tax=Natronospirillum operosum TaxID=2759953 RepID=A0A4Z0WEQ6_9GAMM|nr:TauD/TfdA family dioxygenase [Natronospirillum operosum]TGG93596.1 TauD/TfdA family dioxygenase [Natronospirillum operosum]
MGLEIKPTGQSVGAVVNGLDLSKELSVETFKVLVQALGEHGYLSFPHQSLGPAELKRFSGMFGGLQTSVSGTYNDPVHPEVMTLSNMKKNGVPLGLSDAGQDWHTDMSYNRMIGFANVLHALHVPKRNGVPLGDTGFANMHFAYEGLPEELKSDLAGMTVTHDFNKFWSKMVTSGSGRAPLTAEQKAKRPPSVHPIFMEHPITGRKVLYANPGYAIRINELPEVESDRILAFLFEHQLKDDYTTFYHWAEGDVLIWDNIGTLHKAVADYGPDEARMMIRCQVMADQVFEPGFPGKISASA